jgi:hypothetical protein
MSGEKYLFKVPIRNSENNKWGKKFKPYYIVEESKEKAIRSISSRIKLDGYYCDSATKLGEQYSQVLFHTPSK